MLIIIFQMFSYAMDVVFPNVLREVIMNMCNCTRGEVALSQLLDKTAQ